VFHDDEERHSFLALLKEHSAKTSCDIHAYVLMTNHFHLLVTIRERNSQAALMKSLAQITAHWRHVRHGGTGTMRDQRYHSSLIDSEAYFLTCQRYIESNPVRVGMAAYAGGYRWSSYRANAEGQEDEVVCPHSIYLRLGLDPLARQRAYRALFDTPLAERDLERIRFAIKGNAALRKS